MGRHNSKKVTKIVESIKLEVSKKIKKSAPKKEIVSKKAKNGKQSKNAIVTLPGIVSDIDGVIVKGKD